MTIEQILDCSADQLEALTDEQLLEYFKPFLNVTRPELAPKKERSSLSQGTLMPINTKTIAAAEQLKSLGIDVSYLFHKKSKR